MVRRHDRATLRKPPLSAFAMSRKREKQGLVNEVFSKVAERYDQMNDLMSAGLAPAVEG